MTKPARRPTIPWTKAERRVLDGLSTPAKIQAFLDATTYSADPIYRSPRSVLRDNKAHCFDGAMLAGAALRHHGEEPLLINLRSVRDDDHVLTLFKRDGLFGCIGKSNFVGLRFREPIFRNLRELALSYVESYYNMQYEKSLRAYSAPVDLTRFDRLLWWFNDDAMESVATALDVARHTPIAPLKAIAGLQKVDQRTFDAGMVGVNPDGIYYGPKD